MIGITSFWDSVKNAGETLGDKMKEEAKDLGQATSIMLNDATKGIQVLTKKTQEAALEAQAAVSEVADKVSTTFSNLCELKNDKSAKSAEPPQSAFLDIASQKPYVLNSILRDVATSEEQRNCSTEIRDILRPYDEKKTLDLKDEKEIEQKLNDFFSNKRVESLKILARENPGAFQRALDIHGRELNHFRQLGNSDQAALILDVRTHTKIEHTYHGMMERQKLVADKKSKNLFQEPSKLRVFTYPPTVVERDHDIADFVMVDS